MSDESTEKRERVLRLAGLAVVAALLVLLAWRPIPREAVPTLCIASTLFVIALWIVAPWRTRSRLARVASRVLLAVLASAGAALALDVALHHWPPADPYKMAADDSSAARELLVHAVQPKWTYAPHFSGKSRHPQFPGIPFVTNGDGFRDSEWEKDKTPGRRRILVLGDSMTVGFGVTEPECWPRRLEALLREAKPSTPVRVYNAAVSGYGPGEQLLTAKRLYLELLPTDIVATFYDGNDLDDLRDFLRRVPPFGGKDSPFAGVLNRGEEATAAVEQRIGEHFDTAHAWELDYWRSSWALGRVLDAHLGGALVALGFASAQPVWNLGLMRGMARDAADEQTRQEILLTAKSFTELARSCGGASVRLWLVRIPARVQVVPAEFERLVRDMKLGRVTLDRRDPGRSVLELSKAGGVTVVDTMDALDATDAAACYHAEGHLNARGHAVVADAVARVLAAQP